MLNEILGASVYQEKRDSISTQDLIIPSSQLYLLVAAFGLHPQCSYVNNFHYMVSDLKISLVLYHMLSITFEFRENEKDLVTLKL